MSTNQSNDSSILISPKISIRLSYLLLALGIIAHIALAVYFNFTQDDAFITFRYAANFLNGDGLVYNIGERVEGYTNFLWLIFMILGKLAGVEFVIFSRIAGIFCGIGAILFSFLLAKNIFGNKSFLPGLSCLMLGLVYSVAYWAVSGLEIGAFALAIAASFYFYLRRSLLAAALLVLATLLRPEGGLAFGFIVLYDIINAKKITRYGMTLFTIYLLALLPYLFFKLHYFGGLLPNPFYAKTSFDLKQLSNGLEYTGQFFWHYLAGGLFVLPFLLTYKKWSLSVRTIALFLLIYTFYIVVIGGDVLKVHRFFVPLFPGLIIITVYGYNKLMGSKIPFWIGLILLLGWQLYIPFEHVKT